MYSYYDSSSTSDVDSWFSKLATWTIIGYVLWLIFVLTVVFCCIRACVKVANRPSTFFHPY